MQHKDTQYVHLHPYLLYIDIIFKLEDNLKIRCVGAPLSLGAGYQHKYMVFKQPTICIQWKLVFWWRARQKAATISMLQEEHDCTHKGGRSTRGRCCKRGISEGPGAIPRATRTDRGESQHGRGAPKAAPALCPCDYSAKYLKTYFLRG